MNHVYTGQHNGQEVMFLRQVDDFAIVAATEETAKAIIKTIDQYMTIQIKDLGTLTRYNGVDVMQTRDYIKLKNPTYLKKIIQEHQWMVENEHSTTFPIPMTDEKDYIRQLELSQPPQTEEEKNVSTTPNALQLSPSNWRTHICHGDMPTRYQFSTHQIKSTQFQPSTNTL